MSNNTNNKDRENNSNSTPVKQRYVVAMGQKVYLTPEQQKVWDQSINAERYRARADKACGQPNYHRCFGDCGLCPYRIIGRTLSTDNLFFHTTNPVTAINTVLTTPSAEDTFLLQETARDIYERAAKLVKNGDRILYLKTVNKLSTYKIAEELDMPQTTVNNYVNRILAYMREHRDEILCGN